MIFGFSSASGQVPGEPPHPLPAIHKHYSDSGALSNILFFYFNYLARMCVCKHSSLTELTQTEDNFGCELFVLKIVDDVALHLCDIGLRLQSCPAAHRYARLMYCIGITGY